MLTRIKGWVQSRWLTLVIAFIVSSLVLFPLFPSSPHHSFLSGLMPVAHAQNSILEPLRNLLERTGIYRSPRKVAAPTGRRAGGAGRGPICTLPETETNNEVRALMPFQTATDLGNDQNPEGNADSSWVGGLTTSAQPTFWFYVPYVAKPETLPNRVAQFVLLDESDRPIWNELMTIELREQPRLVEYQLPQALDTEQLYKWHFSVICDSDKLSRNPTVRGWVQRIDPDPELQRALDEASPFEKYLVYANHGIWFETINSLVDIRRQFPFVNRDDSANLLAYFEIPAANQLDLLESATPTEREVVNGNQLPARIYDDQ